ncbi:MAG: ATP-binding protein [Synergistetes bacterium]|nr:ATP-binding protein [Synergistota bacterium]MCX8127905.1 ATP-binding protein [Synergistota bacterium]MDW8192167.1 hypothetical protein [Synergistota bacterium]
MVFQSVSDNEEFKLVILKEEKRELIDKIFGFKGETPRVNVNTIFLLIPIESERLALKNTIRDYLACEYIKNENLNLSDEQKREVEERLKTLGGTLGDQLRRAYRNIFIPGKSEKEDLGLPTVGEKRALNILVYDALKREGNILEAIDPIVIKERLLGDKDYVSTKNILDSSYRTPGALRFANKEVLVDGIKRAIEGKILGLGELRGNEIVLNYYGEGQNPEICFKEEEILIKKEICEQKVKERKNKIEPKSPEVESSLKIEEKDRYIGFPDKSKSVIKEPEGTLSLGISKKDRVKLKFKLPEGRASDVMKIISFLRQKFNMVEIRIRAEEGEINESDYEMKVKEAFTQLGIEFEDE